MSDAPPARGSPPYRVEPYGGLPSIVDAAGQRVLWLCEDYRQASNIAGRAPSEEVYALERELYRQAEAALTLFCEAANRYSVELTGDLALRITGNG